MRKEEYGYVGSIEKAPPWVGRGGATQKESVNPTSEPQSATPKPPFSLHTILCSQTEHRTFRNGKHLTWVPIASSWPAWDVDLCIPFPKPMPCLSIYTELPPPPPPGLSNLGLIGENVHCCWAKKEPNKSVHILLFVFICFMQDWPGSVSRSLPTLYALPLSGFSRLKSPPRPSTHLPSPVSQFWLFDMA